MLRSAAQELGNIAKVVIIGFVALVSFAGALEYFNATKASSSEPAFVGVVYINSQNCSSYEPLEVAITNTGTKEITSFTFELEYRYEGYSSIYTSLFETSSDRIVAPNETKSDCFYMPDFRQAPDFSRGPIFKVRPVSVFYD